VLEGYYPAKTKSAVFQKSANGGKTRIATLNKLAELS